MRPRPMNLGDARQGNSFLQICSDSQAAVFLCWILTVSPKKRPKRSLRLAPQSLKTRQTPLWSVGPWGEAYETLSTKLFAGPALTVIGV